MPATVLLIPGLNDSGPHHWQSLWHAANPGFVRVVQRDWETPDRAEWVAALDGYVTAIEGPVVLVAHSLACITVAHWARAHGARNVSSALLVAPSDVEADFFPPGTTGFTPLPVEALPFPSTLVASTNDPYLPMARARALAAGWGSRLVDVGPAGHIHTDAGFGPWPEGEAMLRALVG